VGWRGGRGRGDRGARVGHVVEARFQAVHALLEFDDALADVLRHLRQALTEQKYGDNAENQDFAPAETKNCEEWSHGISSLISALQTQPCTESSSPVGCEFSISNQRVGQQVKSCRIRLTRDKRGR